MRENRNSTLSALLPLASSLALVPRTSPPSSSSFRFFFGKRKPVFPPSDPRRGGQLRSGASQAGGMWAPRCGSDEGMRRDDGVEDF